MTVTTAQTSKAQAVVAWLSVARNIAITAVVTVALIAAIVSYSHMHDVAQRVGEQWRAYMMPISIDGLVAAAGMTMLVRRKAGLTGGYLAWGALSAGVFVSIAVNIADATTVPGWLALAISILLAGWAPIAFAVGFELLMQLRRAEFLTTGTPDSPPTAQPGAILPQTEPKPVVPPAASTVLAPAFSSPSPVEKSPVARPAPAAPPPLPTRKESIPDAPRKPLPRSIARSQALKNRKLAYVSRVDTPERKREAAGYFETDPGMSNQVIATRLGVTDQTIRKYRREWAAARENGRVSV